MNEKKTSRIRRATRARSKIRELGMARLSVNRTPRDIYAQIIAEDGASVLAATSTLDSAVKAEVKGTGNADAASVVGRVIAEKAKAAGVTKIAFDRSGFKYHGRVKALAEAARENGLEF